MTTFEIDQLIVLKEKHRVEARSASEAIVKVFDGESLLIDIDIADRCHERGLPVEDHPTLVAELREAGIMTDEKVIPSICGIEEVSGDQVEQVGETRFTMPKDAEVEIRFHEAE